MGISLGRIHTAKKSLGEDSSIFGTLLVITGHYMTQTQTMHCYKLGLPPGPQDAIVTNEGFVRDSLLDSMVVSGSPKRWDRWHIIPQLAGKIPLTYTTYSPCLRLGVKIATDPTF